MKKLLLLLFSILISFNSYSEDVELDFSSDTFCDQSPRIQVRDGLFYLPNTEKPYSGENLCVYLLNGQYYSRGEIKKGLRHGKWTWWHENGQKQSERNYKNGEEIGEGGSVITRYSNGLKYTEVNYKDGKEDGKWTRWYKNGTKKSEGNFIDGKEDGKWTEWYKNGTKKSEGNFIDGKKDGKWTESHSIHKGKIRKEENYKKGQLVSYTETEYWSNGKVSSVESYKDGKRDGRWIVTFKGGRCYDGNCFYLEEIYKDGVCISGC